MASTVVGREEIYPSRVKHPDRSIIPSQQIQHGVMQNNIVLRMSLGILDVEDTLGQIDIVHVE